MVLALALVVGSLSLGWLLARERGRLRRDREGLLSQALPVFDGARSGMAADGYPWISGEWRGRKIQIRLVPDLSVLKRLPQLWLVVHVASVRPATKLVLTARPRGGEFISDTEDALLSLDVPSWLPRDMAVRVNAIDARFALEPLREPLSNLFEDARIKEIGLTPKGLRLVYQMAEGDRGSHLLGRQARFCATLDAPQLEYLLGALIALEVATPLPVAA